jgi:hypothetical protein
MKTEADLIAAINRGVRVYFTAPAKLYEKPIGMAQARGGSAIYDGDLGGAIKRFMELPVGLPGQHSISIGSDAIEGCENATLTPRVIWELAKRGDRPQ